MRLISDLEGRVEPVQGQLFTDQTPGKDPNSGIVGMHSPILAAGENGGVTRRPIATNRDDPQHPKRYIVVVVENNEELKLAAKYLKEEIEGGSDLTELVEKPDVEAAIKFWMKHPFDTPLIVADMRHPFLSPGARLNYLRSRADPEISTAVINPYSIRKNEQITDVDKIEREPFVSTIRLELAEMIGIRRRRGGVESGQFNQSRTASAENRKRLVDSLVDQHGDYILRGLPREVPAEVENNPESLRRTKIRDLINRPEYYIQEMMRYVYSKHPDLQNNELLGEIAATLEERVGLGTRRSGTLMFGEESQGGPYTIDERTLLEVRGKVPLGYKPVTTFEEANARKKATDFHLDLREKNKLKANLEDDVGSLWYRARLNPPEITASLPVNGHSQVKPHGAIITVFRGLGLGQIMLPELNKSISEGVLLAPELRDATLEIAMERLGFWRANPVIDLDEIPDTQAHYTMKELRFFQLVNGVLNLGLNEQDFKYMGAYLSTLNNHLVVDPNDLGLRMDAKWYNFGYALEDHPQPKMGEVIAAATVEGLISRNKLREILINYDLGGTNVLVPRYHEFSHIETDPQTRFKDQAEADMHLGAMILDEEMFRELKAGNNARAVDISKLVASLLSGHIKPADVPQLSEYEGKIGEPNRPITDFYRCLEEAEQTLQTRLPRVIVRLQDAESSSTTNSEAYAKFVKQLDTHTTNFWEYIKRATEWNDKAVGNMKISQQVRKGYELVKSTLEALTPRELPSDKVVRLWDGV